MKSPLPKLSAFGTTIFTVMSQWAQEHGAINLSQGFPDFQPDASLLQLYHQALEEGHHQYAPMPGIPALREIIAQKIQNDYQVSYDPAMEITITAGGTQAIFTAMSSVLTTGDEVIVFEPAYDAYAPIADLFGAKLVPIQLFAPAFAIDWGQVKQKVTDKTKLIIINTPNNPTSQIWKEEDFAALAALVEGTGIYVLSDEVYEHVVFDGLSTSSVLRHEMLRNKSFVVASFGKLCHATGWKVGYCVAPKSMMEVFRKIHQYQVFSVHTPAQVALAEYLAKGQVYADLAPFFEAKRNLLHEGLLTTPLRPLPCAGTYFMLADYSQISDLPELDFCKHLTQQYGVATIPISAFYSSPVEQKLIRLCFAKQDHTLERAISCLQKLPKKQV